MSAAAKGGDPGGSNPWLAVAIVCIAQAMVVLDATIVNVALPSIQRGLGFSTSSLQWVINMYTLIFGGFMLLGGRAGDLIGRRGCSALGSCCSRELRCSMASLKSSGMLIVGRGLQGLGGALLTPAVLSIITTTFSDATDRAKALAIWSAIAAGGGAIGLLLGGVLTDLASWRWIFFVNAPVGMALLVATAKFLPESRAKLAHRSLDLAGAAFVTGGLLVFVFGIIESSEYGWDRPERSACWLRVSCCSLGSSLTSAALQAPLVRLGIFRISSLAAARSHAVPERSRCFRNLLLRLALSPTDPWIWTVGRRRRVPPVLRWNCDRRHICAQTRPRVGVHLLPVIGIALAIGGMIVLAQVPVHGRYVSDVLPGLLPLGLGLGLTFVPITLAGTSEVRGDDAGLASGLLNTAQQVGGSIGPAILSTLAARRTSSILHGATTSASLPAARVSGFHFAFIAAAYSSVRPGSWPRCS